MNSSIRINGSSLVEYMNQYSVLSMFSFDKNNNKLVFEGKLLPVSEIVIDELFLKMDINDLRMFIQDDFYEKSNDILIIEKLSKKMFLTENDFDYLKSFVKKTYDRLYLCKKYKDFFKISNEFNIIDSISLRIFLQDTSISNNLIKRAYSLANSHDKDVYSIIAALDTTYQKGKEDIQKQSSSNSSYIESNGKALVRERTNVSKSQWNFNEEEYVNQINKVGAAGFTSIIAVVTVAILFGVYLAIVAIG